MRLAIRLFIGGLVFALVPQAFADCPTGAGNIATQAIYDVDKKRSTATELGPNLVQLAESCKDNGYVQLNAAQIILKMHDETNDIKSRYELVAQAWKYLTVYSKLPPKNLPRVSVDGQKFTPHPDMATNIRKMSLNGLLSYDILNVGHHPYLANSPAFPTCPKSTSITDSTAIVEWVQKRGAQDDGKDTGAMRLLGRLVEACKDESVPLYRSSARYRARILIDMAGRMEDQAQALKYAKQAKVDIDAYLAGEETARFWQRKEAEELSTLLTRLGGDYHQFSNSPDIPREDWFKVENLGSEAVIMAIGFALDEKWALQVGATSAVDGHTEAILGVSKELGLIFAMAKKSDHEIKARNMMYKAMKRHSEGRYRRPKTTSLVPIPDYMWSWLEKEAG